ncbi:MAG: alkaline shock response membrane anchor protein AmaP [Firmicutes bacterium]|jgi:uncharacterized alkaline shock family protein YloU|nr:alkaline shock response membrane anchor protein AmaP [Bacillota bacterium]
MAALRRILLCLWGLITTAAAVLIGGMLIKPSLAQSIYDFLTNCFVYNFRLTFIDRTSLWWAAVFGVLLLAIGIFCIIVALTPTRKAKALRVESVDGGTVDISLNALENVITKAASAQPSVESVSTKLNVKNNGLNVDLTIQVPEGVSVTEAGAGIREAVNNQLAAIANVVPAAVEVTVANVTEKKEAVTFGQ